MNPTSPRGGFVTGLVVGLLIGLGVALAVAVYITKAPVPFINKLPQRSADQDAAEAQKNRHWDPNAPLAGKNPARAASSAATSATNAATNAAANAATNAASDPMAMPVASQPQTVVRAVSIAAVPASAAASRSTRDPAALLAGLPASTAKHSAEGFQYWVQAGAYTRVDDADTQRAKLAMLGLVAKVLEREQAGRVVYRVRVGPFDERADAESAQTKLGDAGVDANLVRAER